MRVSFIHYAKSAWHGEGEVFADLVSADGAYKIIFRVLGAINETYHTYNAATLTVTVDPTEWFFQVNRWMGDCSNLVIEQCDGEIRLHGNELVALAVLNADGVGRIGAKTYEHGKVSA